MTRWWLILKKFLLAAIYTLLAQASLPSFSLFKGNVSLIWPSSGLALAVLILGGRHYWPSIFAGAFMANLLNGNSGWVSGFIAIGSTLEPLIGRWLLLNIKSFNPGLNRPKDYLLLILFGGVSVLAGALIGTTTLFFAELIDFSAMPSVFLNWWQGDTFGIVSISPLILIWCSYPKKWPSRDRIISAVGCFGLLIITGQVIFLGWYQTTLGSIIDAYLMFLLLAWIAVSFGIHGVTVALGITILQAMWGAAHGIGYFAQDFEATHLFKLWIYVLTLSFVSISLALVIQDRRIAVIESEAARREIAQKEKKYRTLFETVGQGIVYQDINGNIFSANPSAESILGCPLTSLQNRTLTDPCWGSIHEDGTPFPAADHPTTLAFKTGKAVYGIKMGIRNPKMANSVWIKISTIPVFEEGTSTVHYVYSTLDDITTDLKWEHELKESEERFRSLANAAPVLIWLASPDKICIWFNDTWLDYTGRSLEQEYGYGWAEGVHSEDLDRCLAIYVSHFDARKPFQMEYRLRRHDGEYRWFIDVGRPRFNEQGKFAGYIGMLTDVNERNVAEAQLRQLQQQLKQMTAAIPGVVYQFLMTPSGECTYPFISKGVEELYEIPFDKALKDQGLLSQCIQADDFERHRASLMHSADTLAAWEHEYRIITPGGKIKWVLGRASPQPMNDGYILWNGILTDITDKKRNEDSLRLSASVFDHAQENIMITDADHNILDVNQAFTRATGYSRDEVLGKNPRFLKSGYQNADFYSAMWEAVQVNGYWRGELWNRNKFGEVYAELLTITAVKNNSGKITNYVGISADITRIKEYQQELEHIAHHDTLTGLPNRILLADRIRQAILQSRRNKQLLALCYLDLDGFKPINDKMGHEAGDLVLIEIAKRISETIRGGDTVARLGGDEFVVLLLGLDETNEYQLTLNRLLEAISQPLDILDRSFRVGASIGVSLFPATAEDPDSLLRQADQAMYSAKKSGKNQYKLFNQ